jgi:hypothetical protein
MSASIVEHKKVKVGLDFGNINLKSAKFYFMIFILSGLSWWATTDGFLTMLKVDMTKGVFVALSTHLLTVIGAGIASAAIIFIQLESISARANHSSPLYTLGYVVAWFISVTFAATFYSKVLGFTVEAKSTELNNTFQLVEMKTNQNMSAFNQFILSLNKLVVYAKSKSLFEEKNGGRGPRYDERRQDFEKLANWLEGLKAEQADLITKHNAISNEIKMEKKQSMIKQYVNKLSQVAVKENNPVFKAIDMYLSKRRVEYKDGNASAQTFLIDRGFANAIKPVLDNLNYMVPVNATLPQLNLGTNMGLHHMISILKNAATGQFDKIGLFDYVAFILGMLIDIAILYLSVLHRGLKSERIKSKDAAVSSLKAVKKILVANRLNSGRELIELLNSHAVRNTESVSFTVSKTDMSSQPIYGLCNSLEFNGVMSVKGGRSIQYYLSNIALIFAKYAKVQTTSLAHTFSQYRDEVRFNVGLSDYNELRKAAAEYDIRAAR